jgi:hypothetical protein
MSAHDRFESLAGAVALGEATPHERALFDEHAAGCAPCRDDAAFGAHIVAQISEARETETWRPSQPIVDRLRAKHGARARRTVGVLGWAVAASLVVNVVFAGGIGSSMLGLFRSHASPPANVVAQRLTLDAPRAIEQATAVVRAPLAFARVRERKHAVPIASTVAAKPRVHGETEKLPTLDDIPDQLAGLDLYGTASAHHKVAVETLPRCDTATAASDAVSDVRPCRDAAGHIER